MFHKKFKGGIKIPNEIKLFNYEENEVRTIEKDGEIWWVLAAVTQI